MTSPSVIVHTLFWGKGRRPVLQTVEAVRCTITEGGGIPGGDDRLENFVVEAGGEI